MSDFLTAVKTVRGQTETPSEPTLTAVQIGGSKRCPPRGGQITAAADDSSGVHEGTLDVSQPPVSPEDALEILRSEPETGKLIATLESLSANDGFTRPFDIAAPGPLQAHVINTLLNTIIPTFWSTLELRNRTLLAGCLSNVTGLNALLAKLRILCTSRPQTTSGDGQNLQDLLRVADHVLRGDHFVVRLWHGLNRAITVDVKRDLAWRETINLLGSGKVVSVIAQAEDVVRNEGNTTHTRSHRLSKGSEYAGWLGRNIASLAIANDSKRTAAQAQAAARFLSKALTLGYPIPLVSWLLRTFLSAEARSPTGPLALSDLFSHLPSYVKRQFLEYSLRWLSQLAPDNHESDAEAEEPLHQRVSVAVAVLMTLLQADTTMASYLEFLIGDPVINSSISYPIRRACLAVLAKTSTSDLQALLERTLTTFGDRIFINHVPILQQEVLAQTLLLAAGYLHRSAPMAVLMTARSSGHMQGVSNRLDASGQRPRWLGMVVGTALSSLVDKEGSKMHFGIDEMQTAEAAHYLELVKVEDEVGRLEDFDALLRVPRDRPKPRQRIEEKKELVQMLNGKPIFGPPRPPQPSQTEVIGEKVTEVLDDAPDDDDDVQPYAKPDSDPEDSDEDATLVNRHKPRPPVYIRTLIDMLRDNKNHDRFQLGIKHAAPLIRRKTGFGAEVTDHAEELMRILCNMQDPFETEDFDELRLQALIAVLLSDIGTLSPWLSRQLFAGDYSISQRCVMLSTLGLGGRELAGFKLEDELNPALTGTAFPSKRLPPRLHAIFASNQSSTKRLNAASSTLEHQLIKPMALHAADQSTAHLNAVKVRTFSSRMEVERIKRKPAANQLAKILGVAVFFPLVQRYQQEIAAYGSSSAFVSASFVLVTFLKTLALLLHASGPATLGLPSITAEFWDLLLSLRVQAVGDIGVVEAVLFSLLTLLEVNTDKRRVAEEHPKQLMETQQWVEMIFSRMEAGGITSDAKDEEAKVRTLAAGVLVKTREVVEAYQRQLFGRLLE